MKVDQILNSTICWCQTLCILIKGSKIQNRFISDFQICAKNVGSGPECPAGQRIKCIDPPMPTPLFVSK